MGINIHALNFLRYLGRYGNLGETLTIGRQALRPSSGVVRRILSLEGSDYTNQTYCDDLLKAHFGASGVNSLDYSIKEGATVQHDLNVPIQESMEGRYDSVIDSGSLEHIFNIPQALLNCSLLCRSGGQIVHVSPANNFCGHGFWQFSPEMFFSLYSLDNGYSETEVFLVENSRPETWFKVRPPSDGRRVNIVNSSEVFILVRTVRGPEISHKNVQQSDYLHVWSSDNPKGDAPTSLRGLLKRHRAVYEFLVRINRKYIDWKFRQTSKLNAKNPGLEIIKVSEIVEKGDA